MCGCVGVCMCGQVYVWVGVCVGVMWVCVRVGVMCGCVCVGRCMCGCNVGGCNVWVCMCG